ncbi:MAG: thiamine pyrophosphate-dependent enzyme, partial [Mycobacteriaceae bacterium]
TRALEDLAAAVAAGVEPVLQALALPEEPAGELTVQSLAAALAVTIPEDAIVVDEANTSGFMIPSATAGSPRHDVLTLTGGAIGQGMPVATGAAVAAPDRAVINVQADGSALYTIQSLWTQAREQLNVTTVLVNNGAYAILRMELQRVGATTPGPRAMDMLDLSRPDINFTEISRGLGVPAVRVSTAEALVAELRRALAEPGPHLIEAMVPPIV